MEETAHVHLGGRTASGAERPKKPGQQSRKAAVAVSEHRHCENQQEGSRGKCVQGLSPPGKHRSSSSQSFLCLLNPLQCACDAFGIPGVYRICYLKKGQNSYEERNVGLPLLMGLIRNVDCHTLPEKKKKKKASFLQGTHMPPVLDPVEKPAQIETETKDPPALATGVIVLQQP